jgi:uncharacterized lipoprotein
MAGRLILLLASALLGGCFFGGRSLDCEDATRYGYSASTAPLRVPEGLDVPDESDALQIPQGEPYVVRSPEAVTECLETPPDFFDE